MKQRCNNPNHTAARWYHDRGIRVCDEWNSYKAFEEWALSHGYADDLTIDRIDPDGNYEPNNCQWITLSENTRKSRRGTKKTSKNRVFPKGNYDVVREFVSDQKVYMQIVERGFSYSEAVQRAHELNKKHQEKGSIFTKIKTDKNKRIHEFFVYNVPTKTAPKQQGGN